MSPTGAIKEAGREASSSIASLVVAKNNRGRRMPILNRPGSMIQSSNRLNSQSLNLANRLNSPRPCSLLDLGFTSFHGRGLFVLNQEPINLISRPIRMVISISEAS